VSRDVFNLEQVEVVKGAAGSDIGRGASSGYINLISKLPTLTNEVFATIGYGTADKSNLTADINRQLGDNSALRLNLMRRAGDVDGRDYVDTSSYGVAPSIAFGLDTATRVYVYSQHVRQDNTPDGGIPTIGMHGFYNSNANIDAGRKVDSENYYGAKGDSERIDGDMFSVKVEHDFNDALTLRNLSRWGRSNNDRTLTGINAISAPSADPSTWTVDRRLQVVDQENEILANQTSLSAAFDTFGLRNELAAGLELMSEKQLNRGYDTKAQTIDGVSYAAVPVTPANLYDPSVNDLLGEPYKTGAYTDGETKTAALYVFDTLHLNQQWALNGGVRFEHYRTETDSAAVSSNALVPGSTYESGDLTSWNAGVLFKPLENGSIYLTYANSMTPPGSGSFALSSRENSADNPAFAPQETEHLELGTKWDLLDQRLALTLAAYRTENDKQVSYDSFTASYFQEGKTRVDGVELGLVGQLSNFWQVSAGIAHMKTKQIDQASRNSRTGVVSETNGVRWSPDLTATLWTSYTLGDLTLGGGARYVSEQDRVVTVGTDLSTQNMPSIPSYWVADAMAAYRVNDNVNLRLNLYNLFDEEYIETLNNGGSRMRLGAPRSAMFTTELSF
jgi:catecholate siderophore receptor